MLATARLPFLWVLAGLCLLVCGWIAWPFLGSLFAAATLAVALAPMQARVLQTVGSRSGAALVTLVLFVTAVVVPAVLVSMAVTDDVKRLVAGAGDFAWLDPWVARFGWTGIDVRQQIQDQILASGRSVVGAAASVAAGIGGWVVSAFITLFSLFYFLREGGRWLREVMSWTPLSRTQRERLLDVMHRTIQANVYGVLAVALAQGALALAGFWLANLPSPLLWAVVTGFFSMIPLVGSAVVWVPAVLFLFATGKTGAAIFLAVWCAGLVSWADNIVRPYVISGQVEISPLLIFFSLLGGVQAFGLVGLFLGPVVVALTGAVLRILQETAATKEASAA